MHYQIFQALRSRLADEMPVKILGPSLEEILNAAKFYRSREWQGLTENEKELLWDEAVDGQEHFCSQYGNFADAIEAKLKEKNAD
jgi:hypothetical protein